MQHVESPTNKCKARFDANHGQVVDALSAGIIGAVPKEAKNGPHYYSSQTLPDIPLAAVPYAREDEVHKAVEDRKYRDAKEKERKEQSEE